MSKFDKSRPAEGSTDTILAVQEVPVAPKERGLGWKGVSPKNPEDRHYAAHLGTEKMGASTPRSASVVDLIVPTNGSLAIDQLSLNTCITNAVDQQLRIDMRRQGVMSPPHVSRLFLYYLLRAFIGDQGKDEGGFVRDAYRTLQKFGYCTEDKWLYIESNVNVSPPPAAYMEANDQKTLSSYYRIDLVPLYLLDGDAKENERRKRRILIQQALAARHAVAFGTKIRWGFSYDQKIEDVPAAENIRGGHALLIVGYDADNVQVLNSWGSDSGENGIVTFSWDYILWEQSEDFWVADTIPLPSR